MNERCLSAFFGFPCAEGRKNSIREPERKFPLFISLNVHSSFRHSFCASEFFWLWILFYMLHNNAAKDQHLNSVCWFFPRVRAWTEENRSQAWQAAASSFLVRQPKMTFPRLAPFAKLNLCSLVPEALKAIWRRNKKFVITSRLWYTAKHRHHVRLRFTFYNMYRQRE